jgi:hypothetical protein
LNQLFTQERITPVGRIQIDALSVLKLIGGYGFLGYGAFCSANGIPDLTDASQ